MRNIEGTWFGSSLVTAIAEHAKDTDLESILKIVQNMVRAKSSLSQNNEFIKQSTSYEVKGWRKRLFFNPGHP